MRYFDAHSDILYDLTARRLKGQEQPLNRHLPGLKAGGAEGACFAIWLDPDERDPAAQTRRMMDTARQELTAAAGVRPVRWSEEAAEARARGEFYIFFSAEGLDAIGDDPGRLEEYAAFGCRSAMLTWNGENALAAGADCDLNRGLSAAGRRAVERMYRLEMLLDVSHLNERSFWQALDAARGPVLASHSNARALCDVPRNLTDAQLRAVRDTGGVVGVNAWHAFLDADPARRSMERLAEHTLHLLEVCGEEHVGCGFDFCGFLPGMGTDATRGLGGSAQAQNFFACLREKGVTERTLRKIARDNFLHLFSKNGVYD